MTDRMTEKGNTQPEEVWVTFWDLGDGDRTYLGDVSEKPWGASYDAPITVYADNVRYVPASRLETAEAENARLREAIDYVLDGMAISAPDYEIDPDDDFLDAANSKWVRDTLTHLAAALTGDSHD
jgi:hypothetical protein